MFALIGSERFSPWNKTKHSIPVQAHLQLTYWIFNIIRGHDSEDRQSGSFQYIVGPFPDRGRDYEHRNSGSFPSIPTKSRIDFVESFPATSAGLSAGGGKEMCALLDRGSFLASGLSVLNVEHVGAGE